MTPSEMNRFELIEASDRHFGTEIGTKFKPETEKQIKKHQEHYPDSFDVAHAIAPYLSAAQEHVVDLVDQIADIASASDVDFARLFHSFVPELEEKVHWQHGPATKMRCTTLVSFNAKGEVLGHDEDWEDGEPSESLAIIQTPGYTGLWYKEEGLGSAIGVNKFGIWQCTNQISTQPLDRGVPRLLTAWHLTGIRSVDEALKFIQDTPQASAFTYVFVQNGQATRVEHARGETVYRQSRQAMVSTNHLIYPPLPTYQREVPMQSGIRYDIGTKFAHVGMTQEEMIAFLSHPEVSRSETLASVVATDGKMHICYGRPGPESVFNPYHVAFANEH